MMPRSVPLEPLIAPALPRAVTQISKLEQLREQDLKIFAAYLKQLKSFQKEVLGEQNNALSYFEEVYKHYQVLHQAQLSGVWGNPLDSIDRRLLKHSHKLMENLVRLQDNTRALNPDSLFYRAASELWSQSVELTQEVLANSRSHESFSLREKRLEVLALTLKRAAAVVKDPTDPFATEALVKATDHMRDEIEGPFVFRNENRLWAGFVGVLDFVIGLTLYLSGIVTAAVSMIGGIVGIVGGVALMVYSANMIYNAIWPESNESNEIRNEKEHSCELAKSFNEIVSLGKNPASLFASSAAIPRDQWAGPQELERFTLSLPRVC